MSSAFFVGFYGSNPHMRLQRIKKLDPRPSQATNPSHAFPFPQPQFPYLDKAAAGPPLVLGSCSFINMQKYLENHRYDLPFSKRHLSRQKEVK